MTRYTKIICGKLYDGLKAELQEKMEILIEGSKIKEVGHELACPEGTEVVDLSHLTVTPGMIEGHIHASYFDWTDVYKDTIFNSDGYRALAAANCAAKTLEGGFTTIRTMGWFREDYILDVKRAINEGYLKGSRMVVAPHLVNATGSHGDMTQVARTNPPLMDFLESLYATQGNGPDFFAAAVRREVKLGADFIKIMATGGFATPNDDPDDIQMSDAELKAIFDTAKSLKKSVTAHAYGPALIQKLIGFGIQGIEHGALMDKETAKMMEDSGTYLVPTFCPYEDSVNYDEESIAKKSAEFRRKLGVYQQRLQEGRRVIIDSKIKLGYGTDFVTVPNNFESGWEYYCWMVNGMDPFRALQAATKTNAEICEIDHLVGTIEPGKLADIAGWSRDLLKDPHALRDCSFVMKEGEVYPAKSHIFDCYKM
jgi:imidazolonepropionase-like amidohydrolase